MKAIQTICIGHDDTNQDMYNVVQACKNTFLFRQNDETSTKDYIKDFKSYWDTCEAYQAEPSNHPKLIKVRLEDIMAGTTATLAEKTKAKLQIKDEFMAGLVIGSANQKRFGLLKRDLQNLYLKGQDKYPKTFEEAKRLLSNWNRVPQSNAFIRPPSRSDGVAFIQSGDKSNDKSSATAKNNNQKKTNSKG